MTTGKGRQHKCTVWWNSECQVTVNERRVARRRVELHPTD